MIPRLSRRQMLIAPCVASVACCSVLSSPPAPQIYRISPVAEQHSRSRTLRKRLVVDIPTASESLDTDRIALVRDRTRFDYYANSLWTDRVPVLVQTLLIDAFENDGSIAEVARDARTVTPEYVLGTEVRQFEALYDSGSNQTPVAVVALDLRLVKMPDHRMLGHTLVTEQSMAGKNSVDSLVEAFDAAVGKVVLQCVAWTVNMLSRAA
ncbi:MAG TPA: ABC-type transport auxiliary lipoprotein family protein [Acetobacteraceae bacterium]|nr:ABC-type transport auxiliary lipoprotein family protein [Acetobacteraceae bacterium]